MEMVVTIRVRIRPSTLGLLSAEPLSLSLPLAFSLLPLAFSLLPLHVLPLKNSRYRVSRSPWVRNRHTLCSDRGVCIQIPNNHRSGGPYHPSHTP